MARVVVVWVVGALSIAGGGLLMGEARKGGSPPRVVGLLVGAAGGVLCALAGREMRARRREQ